MANRNTAGEIVNFGGPQPPLPINPNNFTNENATFILDGNSRPNTQSMNALQLMAENDRLRNMIRIWQEKKQLVIEETINDNIGLPEEVNKRIEYNDQKIRDLRRQIAEQEQVAQAYRVKFAEFQENLQKVMRLDKDIHSRLVNPEQSTTLEKNVRKIMVAINSGAQVQQIAQMFQKIRV